MSLTMNCEAAAPALNATSTVRHPSLLARLFAAVAQEIRIRRDMRTLSAFDDSMLYDIGLGRSGLEDAIRHGRWNQGASTYEEPAGRTDKAVLPLSLTEWR